MSRWSGKVVLAVAVMAWGVSKTLHFMGILLRGLRKECYFIVFVLHLGPVWVYSIPVSYECNDDIRLPSTLLVVLLYVGNHIHLATLYI